jgi:hypothetical protein
MIPTSPSAGHFKLTFLLLLLHFLRVRVLLLPLARRDMKRPRISPFIPPNASREAPQAWATGMLQADSSSESLCKRRKVLIAHRQWHAACYAPCRWSVRPEARAAAAARAHKSLTSRSGPACVCACVCVRVRARVRAGVRVRVCARACVF